MMISSFHRLHLPSGSETIGHFTLVHHEMGANPQVISAEGSDNHVQVELHLALECVNRWNHGKDWKYWI
jgi:hypothetical protein